MLIVPRTDDRADGMPWRTPSGVEPVDGEAGEQAAEEHDFGGEERPHPQLRAFLLLAQVFEVVRQVPWPCSVAWSCSIAVTMCSLSRAASSLSG